METHPFQCAAIENLCCQAFCDAQKQQMKPIKLIIAINMISSYRERGAIKFARHKSRLPASLP